MRTNYFFAATVIDFEIFEAWVGVGSRAKPLCLSEHGWKPREYPENRICKNAKPGCLFRRMRSHDTNRAKDGRFCIKRGSFWSTMDSKNYGPASEAGIHEDLQVESADFAMPD